MYRSLSPASHVDRTPSIRYTAADATATAAAAEAAAVSSWAAVIGRHAIDAVADACLLEADATTGARRVRTSCSVALVGGCRSFGVRFRTDITGD